MISKFRPKPGSEIQDLAKKINEVIDAINNQKEFTSESKIRMQKEGKETYVVKFKFPDGWVRTTTTALEFDTD